MNFLLKDQLCFPSISQVHSSGILAFGGDLSVERLLLAYKSGIFPWYDDSEPITWWAPEWRMVTFPQSYKPPKSLRNLINKNRFKVTLNHDFESVIKNCQSISRKGQQGTWIHDDIITAYTQLYHLGKALSVEVWQENTLVGGLYGVDLGNRIFCGESMFSKVSGASKVGFAWLNDYLKQNHYFLLDCQVYNEHLDLLGAFEIKRSEFMKILNIANKLSNL